MPTLRLRLNGFLLRSSNFFRFLLFDDAAIILRLESLRDFLDDANRKAHILVVLSRKPLHVLSALNHVIFERADKFLHLLGPLVHRCRNLEDKIP